MTYTVSDKVTMPKKPASLACKVRVKREKRIIREYCEAYRAVYLVMPTVSVEGEWVKIQGYDARVTFKRLAQLTTQLINRKGITNV